LKEESCIGMEDTTEYDEHQPKTRVDQQNLV